jgi:hypothetical protein
MRVDRVPPPIPSIWRKMTAAWSRRCSSGPAIGLALLV